MRIGLNATCFSTRPSGANQRFRHLFATLIRRNPDWHFVIYEPCDAEIRPWFLDLPNAEFRPTPLPAEGRFARLAAGLQYWEKALRADRLDLFETFHLPAVIAPECPTVLTIHDVRASRPEAPLAERLLARPVLHHALSRATLTLAVSDTIRDELRALRHDAAVETLYNGVIVEEFSAPADAAVAAVRAHWALPDQFVLTVGHIEARKNLTQLVEAIGVLRGRGLERPLVIIGNPGGAEDALNQSIAQHGLGDLVRVLGGVGHADLVAVYHAARVFAFPSRYEGFGIPLIEALAAGLPVAATDIPIFRELADAAARFFSLDNAPETADAIEALWSDRDLAAQLVRAGQARLALYSFEALADRLAGIYRRLAAGG